MASFECTSYALENVSVRPEEKELVISVGGVISDVRLCFVGAMAKHREREKIEDIL